MKFAENVLFLARLRAVIVAIVVVGAALTLLAETNVIPYTSLAYVVAENLLLVGAVLCALLAFADRGAVSEGRDVESRPAPVLPTRTAYGLMAALLLVTGLLRVFAPGTPVLTFILTAIAVLVVPGLALSFALLPPDAPRILILATTPVLSIAGQLIVVMWCGWLGIAITPWVVFAAIIGMTLSGAVLQTVRARGIVGSGDV